MTRPLVLLVFGLTALAQLAVPGYLIVRHERALREGAVYRFRAAPVDPYDAFRGRYVRIDLEARTAPLAVADSLTRGQRAYAPLRVDAAGLAQLEPLQAEPPDQGDYLKVRVRWVHGGTNAAVQLPMQRFYMREDLAPSAEHVFRERLRNQGVTSVVEVAVHDGLCVIREVYLNETPLAEAARVWLEQSEGR